MISKNQNQDLLTVIPGTNNILTYEQMNTIITLQKLWIDLAMWTRAYIHASINNLENLQAVTKRLYRIPTDFYNVLITFYGAEISQHISNLILTFVTSSRNLIEGMKNNDQQQVDSATAAWYQSADDLATFLSQINIYWDQPQWRNLLYQYISIKIEEIRSIFSKQYQQEILVFERIQNISSIMGSYMARGIIARNAAIIRQQFA